MSKLFLLAGAAAFAIAAPAVAKPGGGGGGKGYGHAMTAHGPSGHAKIATTHARSAHATPSARAVKTRSLKTRTVKIASADQALAHKYGGALCPPGLYKKTPACMPPGQAKRLFRTGQLVPTRYKYITPFGDIPGALVTQYNLTDQNRYIYRNNVIYVIDPVTNRVTRVINAVL